MDGYEMCLRKYLGEDANFCILFQTISMIGEKPLYLTIKPNTNEKLSLLIFIYD